MKLEITVKFKKTDMAEGRKKQIQHILGSAVKGVLQIFPGSTEEQLNTLYQAILELPNQTPSKPLLDLLLKDSSVEYAHESRK
jgi:hypothetical protein